MNHQAGIYFLVKFCNTEFQKNLLGTWIFLLVLFILLAEFVQPDVVRSMKPIIPVG